MPVRAQSPIPARRVYADFVAAELESPRYGKAYAQILGHSATARMRSKAISDWDGLDLIEAERALLRFRGDYLRPLFAMDPAWVVGELPVDEVGTVKVTNLDPFVAVAPSRLISDLVKAMEAGNVPKNDTFEKGYPILRHSFNAKMTRGRPILVSASNDGPYTAIEGLTRLCVQQALAAEGKPAQLSVPVILGTTPRLSKWWAA